MKDENSELVDPSLESPGGGDRCGGVLEGTCPTAYRLAPNSPIIGKGADLTSFGIALPAKGYYGTTFHNDKGYNVGVDSGDGR